MVRLFQLVNLPIDCLLGELFQKRPITKLNVHLDKRCFESWSYIRKESTYLA